MTVTIVITLARPAPDLLPIPYAAYPGISRQQAEREIGAALAERERAKSGRPRRLTYGGPATG